MSRDPPTVTSPASMGIPDGPRLQARRAGVDRGIRGLRLLGVKIERSMFSAMRPRNPAAAAGENIIRREIATDATDMGPGCR